MSQLNRFNFSTSKQSIPSHISMMLRVVSLCVVTCLGFLSSNLQALAHAQNINDISNLVASNLNSEEVNCQNSNNFIDSRNFDQGCLDLGSVGDFNAMIFQDYSASSDVQGRVAVGGNANFASGFSIADQLNITKPCSEPTLVVRGSVNWPNGRNYNGNIVVGLSSPNLSDRVIDAGCGVVVNSNFMDFDRQRARMRQLSTMLGSMRQTVRNVQLAGDMSLRMEFGGQSLTEVVNVMDGNFIGDQVKYIKRPVGMRPGAMLVMNIHGEKASLRNMNMEELRGENVVFNFPQARQLDIRGIGIRGMVMAPRATINNATGVIHGHVVAESMCGPIQVNNDKPPVCNRESIQPDTVLNDTTVNTVPSCGSNRPLSRPNSCQRSCPRKRFSRCKIRRKVRKCRRCNFCSK